MLELNVAVIYVLLYFSVGLSSVLYCLRFHKLNSFIDYHIVLLYWPVVLGEKICKKIWKRDKLKITAKHCAILQNNKKANRERMKALKEERKKKTQSFW